jgi:histidinol-phosphate aminotransferase
MTQFPRVSLSRRHFVNLGLSGAAAALSQLSTARGSEALGLPQSAGASGSVTVRLDSNENPNGPSTRALDAMRASVALVKRYPDAELDGLIAALARHHGVRTSEIVLGCGSAEVLRMATQAFASRARPLVTGAPTFEGPSRHAATLGVPIQAVRVDAALRLDLTAMAASADRAGLVYVCNPNNPTGTVVSPSSITTLVERVTKASPQTAVLVDEAYHEYVDEAPYQTSIPLAVSRRNVIVTRTFSKLHGMAGLRCGYAVAHAETAETLGRFKLESSVNQLAIAAARAAIDDRNRVERERTLNRETREVARELFASLGYDAAPSAANYFMVDLRRDSRFFRDACRRLGIIVGRPFPPLNNYVRISVGTMEGMQRAGSAFRRILGL